jgi:hypothetical protein
MERKIHATALEKLDAGSFDVLIGDIAMPGNAVALTSFTGAKDQEQALAPVLTHIAESIGSARARNVDETSLKSQINNAP